MDADADGDSDGDGDGAADAVISTIHSAAAKRVLNLVFDFFQTVLCFDFLLPILPLADCWHLHCPYCSLTRMGAPEQGALAI